MRIANRIVLSVIMGMAVACGGSNNGGGSGDDEQEMAEAIAQANGDYEGVDNFVTLVRVVDLGSNTAPVAADCEGEIVLTINGGSMSSTSKAGSLMTKSPQPLRPGLWWLAIS